MVLYHATYNAYLDGIRERGLLASPPRGCWSWSDDYSGGGGFGPAVFLSKDADVAESFAETADDVPDDVYDSGIALVSVDSASLDPDLLTYDPFFHSDVESEFADPFFEELGVLDQATCMAYLADIPASLLSFP